jgi:sulfide dehydrogenase cytochrome subunit
MAAAEGLVRRIAVLVLLWPAPTAALGAAGAGPVQAVAPPGATACSGCHGENAATDIPSLQGRSPDEIAAAMQAFRSGERPATVMDRIAKGFTDEESPAIAAWVSRPH